MGEKVEGILTLFSGEKRALSQVSDFRFEYSDGRACDSVELVCIYEDKAEFSLLKSATFLTVFYGEKQVFYGVVDEMVFDLNTKGKILHIYARSLAALLMDNQAREIVYAWADWKDIYRAHIAPYGVEAAGNIKLAGVANFTVSSGSSEWAALQKFCGEYNGKKLRVDECGKLQIGSGRSGIRREITNRHPVSSLSCRVRRYGVYSQVLAFETGEPNPTVVENHAFTAVGGQAQRRIILPKGSGVSERIRKAKLQIEKSMELWQSAEVSLPIPFAAGIGDEIAVEQLDATLIVTEMTVTPEKTALVMTKEE